MAASPIRTAARRPGISSRQRTRRKPCDEPALEAYRMAVDYFHQVAHTDSAIEIVEVRSKAVFFPAAVRPCGAGSRTSCSRRSPDRARRKRQESKNVKINV